MHYGDLAARQWGAISRVQLQECGLTWGQIDREVARGDLIRVRPDTFVVRGAPKTWRGQLWVELLDAPEGSPVSHRAAAHVHGVGPFGPGHLDILEVESGWHRSRPRTRHRTTLLPPDHVEVVDGLPVTTVPRTIFDLAGLVSPKRRRRGLPTVTERQVARTFDDALLRGTTVAQVAAVLARLGGRGRPGTTLVRKLLGERSGDFVPTESELEDLLVDVLVAHGLPLPERQVSLGGAEAPVGRVDFVFRRAKVIVEADGRQHHGSWSDAERDRWRDMELAALGYVVIRVTWRQLIDQPERFVAALRALLAARGAPS